MKRARIITIGRVEHQPPHGYTLWGWIFDANHKDVEITADHCCGWTYEELVQISTTRQIPDDWESRQ